MLTRILGGLVSGVLIALAVVSAPMACASTESSQPTKPHHVADAGPPCRPDPGDGGDAGSPATWSQVFLTDPSSSVATTGLVATPTGGVVVYGIFTGTLDAGGGPMVSSELGDLFVVELDAAGQHVWSRHFRGYVAAVAAVDAAGNVVLGGEVVTLEDAGTAMIATSGNTLLALDSAGATSWSRTLDPDNENLELGRVFDSPGGFLGVDATGDIYVSGLYGGNCSTEKFDGMGNLLWSRSVCVFANDPAGDLVGGWLDENTIVAKLNSQGTTLWKTELPASFVPNLALASPLLSIAPSGAIAIAGEGAVLQLDGNGVVQGTTTLPGETLGVLFDPAGEFHVLVGQGGCVDLPTSARLAVIPVDGGGIADLQSWRELDLRGWSTDNTGEIEGIVSLALDTLGGAVVAWSPGVTGSPIDLGNGLLAKPGTAGVIVGRFAP
jgi:hypothetical protein